MPSDKLLRFCHAADWKVADMALLIHRHCSELGVVSNPQQLEAPVTNDPGVVINIGTTIVTPVGRHLRAHLVPHLLHVAYWSLRRDKAALVKSTGNSIIPLGQSVVAQMCSGENYGIVLQLADARDCAQLALNFETLQAGRAITRNNLKQAWNPQADFTTGAHLTDSLTIALLAAARWECHADAVEDKQSSTYHQKLLTACLYYKSAAHVLANLPAGDPLRALSRELVQPSLVRCHEIISTHYRGQPTVGKAEAKLLLSFVKSEASDVGCYLYSIRRLLVVCEPHSNGRELVSLYFQTIGVELEDMTVARADMRRLLDTFYASEPALRRFLLEDRQDNCELDHYILVYCQGVLIEHRNRPSEVGRQTVELVKALHKQPRVPWRAEFLMGVMCQYGIGCTQARDVALRIYQCLEDRVSHMHYYVIPLNRLALLATRGENVVGLEIIGSCIESACIYLESYLLLATSKKNQKTRVTATARLRYVFNCLFEIASQASDPGIRLCILNHLVLRYTSHIGLFIQAQHMSLLLELIEHADYPIDVKISYCEVLLTSDLTLDVICQLNRALLATLYVTPTCDEGKKFARFLGTVMLTQPYEKKLKLDPNYDRGTLLKLANKLRGPEDKYALTLRRLGLMNVTSAPSSTNVSEKSTKKPSHSVPN